MGSASHPDAFLVLEAVTRALANTQRNGGVLPAVAESRRLAVTYPESGMSEEAILREFCRRASELGLLTDVDTGFKGGSFRVGPSVFLER